MQQPQYRSLRIRFLLVILGFSLLPLFVLGTVIRMEFSNAFTDKVMRAVADAASANRRAIDMFLDERIAQLATLARTHTLEELGTDESLARMFDVMQKSARAYIDLGVIDAAGRHVAYVGPYDLKGVNYKGEPWFDEAMLRGLHVSDVFLGHRNFPHFIIAVRVGQGSRAWLLRATIDSDIFTTLVRSVRPGKNSDAFLVNAAGLLQTPSQRGKLQEPGPLGAPLRFSDIRVQKTDLYGGRIVGTAWLSRAPWMLTILEDPQEALNPLLRATYLAWGFVLLGTAVIFAGAWCTVRSVVHRLEERDREKALLDASLLQSSKMAALGKLAAGVAHEVNNPLALIGEAAGWIDDLLADKDEQAVPDLAEIRESVRAIVRHVERARSVTHRMLGFARRMEPEHEVADLNTVVGTTLEFLRNEALYRNITLETRLDPALPSLRTDTAQLQQVLLNILENALDAVDHDGKVRIRTFADGDLCVEITDTGPGMSPETAERIFDPFFTTKAAGEGTGLGLSIAYGIMDKLGGSVKVASTGPDGTTFRVTLPNSGNGGG
ncbi:MAG: two-component sensor histidine kinase [Desulfovibrionaceae bacterium]|jgi:two-component system NtrC family sensor kinase|nr:two-component sensor histidine kinase [Desulfovibrionaceae bacterium]